MNLTHDELFTYTSLMTRNDTQAHIRIFEAGGQLPVVIVGQLDDNNGTSITQMAEYLAEQIADEYFPEGREFVYIEFYPGHLKERRDNRTGNYSATAFDLSSNGPGAGDPDWTERSRSEIESLVGCSLPEWPEQGSYTTGSATHRTPA